MRRLLVVVSAALVLVVFVDAGEAAAPVASSNLLVTAVEYRLELSRGSVPAGTTAIQLVDDGMDPHDLALRRINHHGHLVGPTFALPQATPGTLTHRSLRLAAGHWKLWCTLPGHEMRGMRAVLSVTRASRRSGSS